MTKVVNPGLMGKIKLKAGWGYSKLTVSRRGKYNARGRWIDKIWFASNAEAVRYEQLKELLKDGVIADLECHPAFECRINSVLICVHKADFKYRIKPGQFGSRIIVEDVKGIETTEYRLMKNLMKALHPTVEITELKVGKGKDKGDTARWRFLTADQITEAPRVKRLDPRAARKIRDADRRARAKAAAADS